VTFWIRSSRDSLSTATFDHIRIDWPLTTQSSLAKWGLCCRWFLKSSKGTFVSICSGLVLRSKVSISIYGSTVLLSDLCLFFRFLILYTLGRTASTGDQLPTQRTTQTQSKRKQTSMPWVGFDPTIPAFGRAKIVHASDRAATVIGYDRKYDYEYSSVQSS
jgi:hypothetical protein